MESIIRKIKDVDSNWRGRAYRSLCYLGLALGLIGCGTIKKAGIVATAAGTYLQHLRKAMYFAGCLLVGSVCAVAHALVPCILTKTTTKLINHIQSRLGG